MPLPTNPPRAAAVRGAATRPVTARAATRAAAALAAAGALLAAGCTPGEEDLPEAAELLSTAADEAAGLTSVAFGLQASEDVPGVNVRGVDGAITTEGGPFGSAEGTATLALGQQLVESDFVLEDETLHLQGPTGGFQEVPAERITSLYDPSAVLDPDRGLATVLNGIADPETVGTEDIDGTETFEVTGTVAGETIAEVVPGVDTDAEATVWLDQQEPHLPARITLAFPEEGGETPTVDLALSEYDEPVSVTPPE